MEDIKDNIDKIYQNGETHVKFYEDVLQKVLHWAQTTGIKIIIGFVFLWIGFKIIKIIVKNLNKFFERRNADVTVASFLENFVNISLKLLLILLIMNYIGLATSSIVAVIGSAGIAIGLALQGSLANFAGGVIILFLRPFNVGDYIQGAGETGTIETIGIFYTHMLTIDNKRTLIPNGTLVNGIITNYTAQKMRRVDLTFGVGYEDDIRKVKAILYEIINNEEHILKDPAPFVGVSELADSSVNFIVKAWTKTEDYWTVYYDLLEKVKIRFDEENINIPYPQMDVHLKKD
ncbi:MAG TPA: mechanosensitive ion channel protein MscS [Clostridium sp.]|nr:mechanosensitive ion channel protein MscS [Clostridium sp.]